MSQWEKLIAAILTKNPNLRFEDLCKALSRIGYQVEQPGGGSSHFTFRKANAIPVTLPKKRTPMDKIYVDLVAQAIAQYLSEEASQNET
ncbi:MAG: toxin HicA [Pseudoflavonifractor sp.]